jgi:hypothetical protein
MKVLHLPTEISGQASLSVRGLRSLGIQAFSALRPHPFGYNPPDHPLPERRGVNAILTWAKQLAFRFDVYHYHFADSVLGEKALYLDAWLERLQGARVVPEFWGSDVRLPYLEARRNPYYRYFGREDQRKALFRMAVWSRLARGHALVSDEQMASYVRPFFRHVHIVPQRVDVEALLPQFPDPSVDEPLLVHAPSAPPIKGTEFVRRAVERLKARGLRFRYVEITGKSHSEVLHLTRHADLVVDQLLLGVHGVYALEAMALGKPVIAYIAPYMLGAYPQDLPIVNANPDTIEAVLRDWLSDGEARRARGEASRAYVERRHDYRVVAQQLLEIYASL